MCHCRQVGAKFHHCSSERDATICLIAHEVGLSENTVADIVKHYRANATFAAGVPRRLA
jgi:hypothetical protein